jgi:hypothetical protein
MEDKNEFDLEPFVERICRAKSRTEAVFAYISGLHAVWDMKFIIASPDGAEPGFAANRDFANGAAIRSLFRSEKVLFLDPKTIREAIVKRNDSIPFDYSISLDSMALSHLKPFVSGRNPAKIDPDLKEVFEFIAQDDVHVDPLAYMSENLGNLAKGQKDCDEVFSRLRAYEVLRTLDKAHFKATNEARSYLTDAELDARAQRVVAKMLHDSSDPSFMEGHGFQHAFAYAYLLKMSAIVLRRPQSSIDNKMWQFVEFCDNTLATFGGRETVLARAYFERGQDLNFFGRVQKKNDDLLRVLKNMAWDLSHARRMELGITLRPDSRARYFLPALLTFDKDFIEVLDLYPLKACAFEEKSNIPMPFFDGDWKTAVATTPEKRKAFFKRFFSEDARSSRDQRRSKVRKGFRAVIADLESEVCKAAGIEPRCSPK